MNRKAQVNPIKKPDANPVMKGGSWYLGKNRTRITYRIDINPNLRSMSLGYHVVIIQRSIKDERTS